MSSREWGASGPELERLLSEAFREGLDLPPDIDLAAMAFGQHEHWDSLGHVSLIIALEKRFNVQLSGAEVMELNSYAAAAKLLASRQPTQP